MYYIVNLEKLGEQKIITYCNKYINNIIMGCNYLDQSEVTKLAPNIEDVIPEYFLNMLKDEFN
jgi:hypothetical protein